MATKKEWVNLFESVTGRKPSAAEYAEAMANGFDTTLIVPETNQSADNTANTGKNWAKLFESVTGRKPTANEFMQGKNTNFDPAQIASITNAGSAAQTADQQSTAVSVSEAQPTTPASKPVAQQSQQAQETAIGSEQNSQDVASESRLGAQQPTGQVPNQDLPLQNPVDNEAPIASQSEQTAEQPQSAGNKAFTGKFQDQEFTVPEQVADGQNAAVYPQTASGAPQGVNQGDAAAQHQPNIPQMSGQAVFQPNPAMSGQVQGMTPNTKVNKTGLVIEIILPIVSIVVSLVFAALSFVISAPLFAGLSVLSLIFAGVLFILNLKGKKLFFIIALVVAVLAIITSSLAIFVNSSAKPSDNKTTASSKSSKYKVKDNSTNENDYIDKKYKFEWKKNDFKELKIDSDSVSDVIEKHGKASDAEITEDDLTLIYKGEDANSVVAYFEKEYDGTFILKSVYGRLNADDITTNSDYKSNWKQSDYDNLKTGDSSTGSGGTKWSEIHEKYGNPTSAWYTISLYDTNDKIEYKLFVSYSDYDADDSHLDNVSLTFASEDDGKTYNLASKSN
ncbi:hypothetical protein ACVR0S_07005 [Streptococcus dentapri]|uniref:MFS transporter n=1 Tax=Streptococcus dentapri TaxID=573564 RepID=A0ABV8CZP1_9STRE